VTPIIYAVAAVAAIVTHSAQAQDKTTTALQRCQDLKGLTIAPGDIGLPTKGASVTQADRAPVAEPKPSPDGEFGLPIPERCIVQGKIEPVDPNAPPVTFNVNLPNNWNGKALQSGGGGLGGALITAPNQKGSGRFDPIPLDLPYPITLGYVTFGDDDGHQGPDVSFTKSDEALRNWASEAHKKTRDVALAIIRAAYGRAPDRLYFSGESAGGREAVIMAQKFPRDYDGIIATSPVLSWYAIHLADNAIRDRLIQGWLDAKAISLIAEKTRATCDEADGLKDGVIARYMECPNNVAALRCPEGKPGDGCLSDAQISAVNAIREPWSMIVPLAHGVTRYAGFGVTGDEDGERYQYAFYTVGTERPSQPLESGRGFEPKRGAVLNFSNLLVRHTIVQDSAFDPYQFDPRPYAKRIQYLSALFDATNPDLSEFRNRGGKMIILQPSADNAVGTPMIAEYYRSVVAKMGQEATDEMLRFYVGHGGGHNVTGTSQVDTLTLLENWIEKGQSPPDAVTAYNVDTNTLKRLRSMPACRYPSYSKYNGSGDPNSAESFTCEKRPDPLAFDPKP
jgi:feruloyl esterase